MDFIIFRIKTVLDVTVFQIFLNVCTFSRPSSALIRECVFTSAHTCCLTVKSTAWLYKSVFSFRASLSISQTNQIFSFWSYSPSAVYFVAALLPPWPTRLSHNMFPFMQLCHKMRLSYTLFIYSFRFQLLQLMNLVFIWCLNEVKDTIIDPTMYKYLSE